MTKIKFAAALVVAAALIMSLTVSSSAKAPSAQAAQEQINKAEKALKEAQAAEAQSLAAAAFGQAKETLALAKELYEEGEYERAEMLALAAYTMAVRAKDTADYMKKYAGGDSEEDGAIYYDGGGSTAAKAVAPSAPPPPSPASAYPAPAPSGQAFPPAHGGTRPPNNAAFDAMFFENYGVNPFIDADEDNLSTFAADVDTGSYTISRKYILEGHLPPKDAVRPEEFINYFRYDYQKPQDEAFKVSLDGGPSVFGTDKHRILRVGIQGKEVKVEDRKPSALTFVIDVSGSMDREDRLGLVKKSLNLLIDQLDKDDTVGIVIYGSEGQVLMEHKGLSEEREIRKSIEMLLPSGATNAEEGLYLGYQQAALAFKPGAINRVILCSDGVANVGLTGADQILEHIREFAERGVTLSAIGFGMGNYNDVLMEKLANKGDGNYYYVDTLDEARRVFVENLTGTLQLIAKDVKIQVEFNEKTVRSYRLIGYENRDVADEDFRDDKVDAGEIGAGHQVTALYEIKMEDGAEGVIATVRVRHKSPDREARVREVESKISTGDLAGDFGKASPDFRLAVAVSEFAELLRKSYWAKEGNMKSVMDVLQGLPKDYREQKEVIELINLVSKAGELVKAEGK